MTNTPTLSFQWGPLEEAEDIHRYVPGGYHPVRLGDVIESDTASYRVLNKLGHGSFSTVWFARTSPSHDGAKLPRYVALKICAADGDPQHEIDVHNRLPRALGEERHILHLLDSFSLNGPNGTHVVLVHDVLASLRDFFPLEREHRRQICHQVAQGVRFLHSHGIAHGDLHVGNIGVCLPGLDKHAECDILDYFGEPEVTVVLTREQHPRPESLPPYVLGPFNVGHYYKNRDPSFNASPIHAELLDLGNAVITGQEPRPPCTPPAVCAPEIMFERVTKAADLPATFESDIWSLACTLYEIAYGGPLFYWASPNTDLLQNMAKLCGEVPADWKHHLPDATPSVDTATAEWEKRLPQKMWAAADVTAFGALLRSMMKMDPRERPTAEEVLRHHWFSLT